MKLSKTLLIFFLIGLISCEKEPVQDDTPEDPIAPLEIFDLVGQLQLNEGPHDLVVSGNHAFASRNDIISVINLSDPSNPTLLTSINDLLESNNFESMAISNNILYAGCTSSGSIYMIDITNPSSPSILGKFNDIIYSTIRISPMSLFIDGNTLWAGGSNGSNGMIVKFLINSQNSLTVQDYWVSNETGSAIGGIWANSSNAFISTANGFIHSFAANNLTGGPLDSFTFTNEAGHEHWGKALVGKNSKLYWADWGAGFVTIDISNPSNLTSSAILTHSSFITQHPEAEGTNVYDIAMKANGEIYLANGWSGLVRLHESAPGIVEDYVDYQYHQNYCMALYDKYAIMGNISGGISGNEKGIKIIKIE
jgi:hypothetical protein